MSISTWLVLLESVELHSRQMFTALTWPQVQLTLLVLWWGAVKPSADRNDGQRGSESSRELIQSWLGKLTFLFRKVQLSIQISHSFWLNRHLFLQIPDPQKKPKWVTEPVGRKIPSRKFRPWIFVVPQNLLGYLDDHQHLSQKRAVCETCI